MFVRKIGLGVAALTMPLTALAAAPAQATTVDRHDRDRVSVQIRDVDVDRGDLTVEVRYFCDSRRDGRLEVTLRQDGARYSGDERVECDGWGRETVTLERDRGRLEDGSAVVRAELEVGWAQASDRERVHVDVRDRRHH